MSSTNNNISEQDAQNEEIYKFLSMIDFITNNIPAPSEMLQDPINREQYDLLYQNFGLATPKKQIQIKTYSELCKLTGLKPSNNNKTKQNQLEELKNFLKITYRNKKYTISQVYSYQDCIQNKIKSNFNNKSFYNFYTFLCYYYEVTKSMNIILDAKEISYIVNFISQLFIDSKNDLEKRKQIERALDDKALIANITRHPELKEIKEIIIKEREQEEEYTTPVAKEQLSEVFTYTTRSYNGRIEKLLAKIEKECLILTNQIYIGIYLIRKSNYSIPNYNANDYQGKEREAKIKQIIKYLDFDETDVMNDLKSGKLIFEDLLELELEKKNATEGYYYASRVLTEDELEKMLSINWEIFTELDIISQKEIYTERKKEAYDKKRRYKIKVNMGFEGIYKAYSITFNQDGANALSNFYKEKLVLGKDFTKSLDEVNKDFVKDLKQRKAERETRENLPIQEWKNIELNKFYYNEAVDKVVRYSPSGCSPNGYSPSGNSPSSNENIPESLILPYQIKEGWDNIIKRSEKIKETTKEHRKYRFI